MFIFYVFRVTDCVSAGNTAISIAVDGGKPYEAKVQKLLRSLGSTRTSDQPGPSTSTAATIVPPQPPVLPVTGWKAFPSQTIPLSFSYNSIYEHIITTATLTSTQSSDESDGNAADVGTAKPMRKGRFYFTSGHVTDIEDATNANKTYYFLKCLVRASYRQQQYRVTITLASETSKVVDSTCECKASSMGRCSHVAGLLFALEDYTIVYGYEPTSSTSKLCSWNVGRKRKNCPQTVHTLRYKKKYAPDRIISHDPRPVASTSEESTRKFSDHFVVTLGTLSGKSMFHTIVEVTYDDYELDTDRRVVLSELVTSFMNAMSHETGGQIREVENTSGQGDSEAWHAARRWRITASRAKSFATARTTRVLYNLLRQSLFSTGFTTSSMAYGTLHEGTAFRQYKEAMEEETGLCVRESGLWVNPAYPGFGASPDGLVYDQYTLVGVIEIKCPAVLEKCHPVNAADSLTKKQMTTFCCRKVDDGLRLKIKHTYYHQVQMQMAVCGVLWCDFIVWSPLGIHVERIERADAFWLDTSAKLDTVYRTVVVPEFFEMRVPRRLLPFRL